MSNDLSSSKEKFFDRWASTYDFMLTTIFYQAIHQRLSEYVELPSHATVLDLGCGTGRLLDRLATQFSSMKGIGCDFSKEMLHRARAQNSHRPRLIYVQGNAESLPFAENQFDAVFNTISFLHYPQPERVIAEISRVLKQDGRYYLVDAIVNNLDYFPFSPGGIRFYTKQQREALGRAVGLNCIAHHHLLSNVVLSIFVRK